MATLRVAVAPGVAPMKVAQISKPGGDFEIVEREIPTPGAGHVRIKVQACGICHSDVLTKEGLWPGIQFPRIPGHEVAGVIDELGAGVSSWKKGQRVGVGWHGGQDNTCDQCRRGDFGTCRNLKIPGISYDGGYQQFMLAPVEALAAIPDSLSDVDAAPPRSTPCGIAVPDLAIWLPYRASAAWVIWGFSLQTSSDTESLPSDVVRRMHHWRRSWARTSTLTARQRTLPRNCRSWAARRWF
jgi:hypothetical protein